jgi:hypothetical protein
MSALQLQYMRADEQATAETPINPQPLLGTWLNTNGSTQGIRKAVLEAKGQEVVVRVFASGNPDPFDWKETTASLFATDAGSSEAMAFSAFYDFGFMETQLQAHVRQGVLIIAKFDRFKDNSGRSNYFSKEFFYRANI